MPPKTPPKFNAFVKKVLCSKKPAPTRCRATDSEQRARGPTLPPSVPVPL